MHEHNHGTGLHLSEDQQATLARGLEELLKLTTDITGFTPLPSERFPLPLALAVYGRIPEPSKVRGDLEARMRTDPVSVLEQALVLVELYECSRPDSAKLFPDDMTFAWNVFSTKWANGWCHLLGGDDTSRQAARDAIGARWHFTYLDTPTPYRSTGCYVLIERLIRYAIIYGRCRPGDPHGIGHFIEEHTPGVLVCRGPMSDLELTLSLALMKLGVPAVVPSDYPFTLGRTLRVSTTDEIADAVVGFANIRRLLKHPALPGFPDYCQEHEPEAPPKAEREYGADDGSFYLVRKAAVECEGGVSVDSSVSTDDDRALGMLIEIAGEPLDDHDIDYIERSLVRQIWRLPGHSSSFEGGKLIVGVAAGAVFDAQRLGELLRAAVRHDFPKLAAVSVRVSVGRQAVTRDGGARAAAAERLARLERIRAITEQTMPVFYGCVGCSPFAPDHVCVLTVDRVPQCGRPFGLIKTGAHYGYDDMAFIHHSKLHRDINSFFTIDKGECIDPLAGEWTGVNAHAARMTAGRTTRIQLHSLRTAPTTGCGCFNFIMFTTDTPRAGIGIMHGGYEGRAPDGRRWSDLHCVLAGKQAPGLSGCSTGYFSAPTFLQADGGWNAVVWVSSKVAAIARKRLPADVTVGD